MRELERAHLDLAPPSMGQNYIGHTYTGHNYIGHNYIGHNYIGHNYMYGLHVSMDAIDIGTKAIYAATI